MEVKKWNKWCSRNNS